MKLRCLNNWEGYLRNMMGDESVEWEQIDIHRKSKLGVGANKVMEPKWCSSTLGQKVNKNWF